ncbi:MAG: DUF362 domain-containing protein [Candidatus Bathyarchaeia archaeon]
MAVVSLVRNKDPGSMISEAVNLLGGIDRFVGPKDVVFIKPNVCGGVPGKVGTFTNPQVLEALIKLAKGRAERVLVGEADSCMYTADVMLKETGIREAAEALGAEVVNLSKGDMVTMNVPEGYVLREFKAHKALADATKIISVPVMKTHLCCHVTLCMKNLFGVLPERRKSKYHSKLDHVIADVANAFLPHLCVVDATVGLEGEGPFKGDPIELGLVIGGDNVVATDACAAAVMGLDPSSIDYLRLASEKGIGPINLKTIEIKGRTIEEVRREFKRAPQERLDRTLSRLSSRLGYYAIHGHYESAVKSWREKKV